MNTGNHVANNAPLMSAADRALFDAGEGSDLMLQVLVGERDHVAAAQVL